MRKLLQQLASSQGLKQSFVTVVGNTAATGISAISLIIISRVLGPTSFGEFTVGFSLILILNKLQDLGLSATLLRLVPQSEKTDKKVEIISYTATIKFAFAVVLMLIGLIFVPFLANFIHFSNVPLLYAAYVFSVFSTLYEHLLASLQSMHRFSQAVVANFFQSTTKLVSVLVLSVVFKAETIWFFMFYMAAPLVPVIFHKTLFDKSIAFKPVFSISQKTKANIWGMAKHVSIGFMAAGIIENIDVFFVQKYLSVYETGLLGGVSRIAMMVSLIAYSLANVLNPRVAKYTEKVHISSYVKKAWGLVLLAVVGFLCFLPFSGILIKLTIGDAYQSGTEILNILALASFLTVAAVPFQALFYSYKSDWYFSVSGVLQLVIILIGNAYFVPQYGLLASAWTRVISRVFLFIFSCVFGMYLFTKHDDLKKNDGTNNLLPGNVHE